jgi:hypothetical protein
MQGIGVIPVWKTLRIADQQHSNRRRDVVACFIRSSARPLEILVQPQSARASRRTNEQHDKQKRGAAIENEKDGGGRY